MEWDTPHLWDTSHLGRNFVRTIMSAARRNQTTLLLQSWEQSWEPSSDFTHIYAFSHDLIRVLLLTEELSTSIDNVANRPVPTTNLVKEQVSLNKSADTKRVK